MNWRTHRLLSMAIVAIGLAMPIVSLGIAELDHLVVYQVKDLYKVQPGTGFTLANEFGTETCELKKAKFFLVQSSKNDGDDVLGGPAGNFFCYKAKCGLAAKPNFQLSDQFGLHAVAFKKVKFVCAPAVVNNLPECSGPDTPCGACGTGTCQVHVDPSFNPPQVCVDTTNCANPGCANDAACAAGSVCVMGSSSNDTACCPTCP